MFYNLLHSLKPKSQFKIKATVYYSLQCLKLNQEFIIDAYSLVEN